MFLTGTGAAQAQSLQQRMFGKDQDGRANAGPSVARFESDDGETFILDESGRQPLLRFEGDTEVWSLTVTQGAKGDRIYKNDVGQPVLKSTRWGGMILFTDERPTGDPVAMSGKADAFRQPRMSPALLWQTLAKGSKRVSQALGRLVPFEAPNVTPGADALYAQAADVTSSALVQVALQSKGKQRLTGVESVQFVEGRPPSATLTNGVLVMKLDTSRGNWGGHVSSKRIVNVILTSYSVAERR
ncbi:hypothetical protein ABI_26200 [Asticcacaulis biprosthecium C19]|uniref:DUF4908 domain-containing protein n=1 Tax=Asticcacaulis biprosthecium C19 TaxID=715226 RepID=F4QPE7_9CAUL|nr:DUF4908 domain-containing protein [Asticcacaulis biprosthecium]EGF91205.1 hypothetical protein ABI_26200 [Asticcacaulis biprosthecium C19]